MRRVSDSARSSEAIAAVRRSRVAETAGVRRRTGSRVKCFTKQTEWLQRSELVKCANNGPEQAQQGPPAEWVTQLPKLISEGEQPRRNGKAALDRIAILRMRERP
jgi:hypothetical protein